MAEDSSQKQTFPRFWLFVILVLGSVILGDLNQRMADARSLEKDLEFLQARSEQLDQEIKELNDQIDRVNTDDFIADWAHQEAKMVKGGEVLVIFVPTGIGEEEEVKHPESGTLLADELEVWLELVFGR